MRIGIATLTLAFAVLSSVSTANGIDQLPFTAATSSSSLNCPSVPPKAKLRTVTTASAHSGNPGTVVQICAPVLFSVSTPASSPSDKSLPLPQKVEPLSDAGVSPGSANVESADSFRFKIKDILEAEVKSGSRWLVWSVVAIFAVFAALIVLVAKSPAAKSVAPWMVWLVGVAIVASLMLFVVPRSPSNTTSQIAVDKLFELYTSKPQSAANESVSRLELQVDQLRRELRERDSRPAASQAPPSRSDAPTSSPGLLIHMLVLGILAATVAIAMLLAQAKNWSVPSWPFASRNTDAPSHPTVPGQEPLPLDAIFRLEDELSMLAMNSDKTYRLLEADKRPKILSPAVFLRTLNTVRRKLEGAQTSGEDSEYLASFYDFNFKEDAQSYDFYQVNNALSVLEETLSSRYESKEKEWRPRALAALASARRALIAVCEPDLEGLATGTGDSTA